MLTSGGISLQKLEVDITSDRNACGGGDEHRATRSTTAAHNADAAPTVATTHSSDIARGADAAPGRRTSADINLETNTTYRVSEKGNDT